MQDIKHIEGLTYLTVIKYVSNHLSGENIAIGLIAVNQENSFFRISQRKVSLVKRLNPEVGKLLDFSISQLNKLFKEDITKTLQSKLLLNKILSLDYINRLSVYNNGVLQFSSPQSYNILFKESNFNEFFKKFITDKSDNALVKVHTNSHFDTILQQRFYGPLKDKIDVDYVLKKQQLPSLLFDFHLDGIGVNGVMYAVKSIDINSQKKASQLKVEISEYESVLDRLDRFAKQKGLSEDSQYHLIFEEYNGKIPSLLELSSILNQNNMPLFKVSSTKDVKPIVDSIINSKAKKFSEAFSFK